MKKIILYQKYVKNPYFTIVFWNFNSELTSVLSKKNFDNIVKSSKT